jgi:nucleoside-diphosphate-sugar epimerase
LIERGHCVSCLVRGTSRKEALLGAGAKLLEADITDRQAVTAAVREAQPQAVVHLAGLVRAHGREQFDRVNAGGVESVAIACASLEQPPVLVVVSSLAAAGPCEANEFRSESDAPSPVSIYGRSKLAGEQAATRHASRVPITIVRPPIVFGPGDVGVLEMFRPIARLGVHLVPGRGEHRLSMIHVDDLAEGLIVALARGERMDGEGGDGRGVYFMAADETLTFAELGRVMAAALDRSTVRVVRVPGPLLRVAGRCGDVVSRLRSRRSWINSDKVTEALAGSWMCSAKKARDHLGWAPTAPLAERLRETALWYRQEGWL